MFSSDRRSEWSESVYQSKPSMDKKLEQAYLGILALGMSVITLAMTAHHAVSGVTLLPDGLVAWLASWNLSS